MGLYSRIVLPRLIDYAMKHEELDELRANVVPKARGRVLEIGVGSGRNFPFYTDAVRKLYALDPSPELLAMSRQRIAALPFSVGLIRGSADALPLPDASVDTVVITFSLCSIARPAPALREARRVLTPAGQLLFAEHGLSPEGSVQTWQNRLTPIWRRVTGGCHLNRKMDDLITSAGFSIAGLETRYISGPRLTAYIFTGTAERT